MHEFFSFNFPFREYFFCTSPAPHKFSNCPSLANLESSRNHKSARPLVGNYCKIDGIMKKK